MRSSTRLLRVFQAVILTCAVILIVMAFGCSKSTGVDDDDSDRTPPVLVSDLSVISSTSETAMLRWTTPEDHRDDGSGGMVDGYDLRVSFDSITAQTFPAATVIASVPGPLPAGLVQQWSVGNLTPDSVHYFALKARDDRGNWSGISNCAWVHCAPIEVVTFADSILERKVREQLHKPTGDILTNDVDTIWQVVASESHITSLVGLEHFTSLLVLQVSVNNISDLSPLSGLAHLGGLALSDNQVSDLTPLSGMISLRQINLEGNPITDIAALATIDSLQLVVLNRTAVVDFSPLYDLMFLSDVNFWEMHLTDISFMSHLRRPQRVGLAFNTITSVEPLGSLYMIESLNLQNNQIVDITRIGWLTGLRELRLTNNQITDLLPLVHNPGIDSGDVVWVDGNPLSSYSRDTLIQVLENRKVIVHQ